MIKIQQDGTKVWFCLMYLVTSH